MHIYFVISTIIGWLFLSKMQKSSGIIFFSTIGNYIFIKLLIALCIGWLITPFYILYLIIKMFVSRNNTGSK